jgi:hypothetical protein
MMATLKESSPEAERKAASLVATLTASWEK